MDFFTVTTSAPVEFVTLDFDQRSAIWLIVFGIILAYWLAVGMGANDVSNAFDASWGNEIVSITAIFGAIFVGFASTNTVRRNIVDLKQFETDPYELMLGQIAILVGSTSWILTATYMKLPVSPSESLLGAIVGFAVVRRGIMSVHWNLVGKIVTCWFLTPLASALLSMLIYVFIDITVLRRDDPFKCAMRFMPFLFFIIITINMLAILWDSPENLFLHEMPTWVVFVVSIGGSLVIAIIIYLFVEPCIRRRIPVDETLSTISTISSGDSKFSDKESIQVRRKWNLCKVVRLLNPKGSRLVSDVGTMKLFGIMQMLTAGFSGFAGGASDMSNIIAPISILIDVFITKTVDQAEEVPIYVMLLGVVGRCAGLWSFGDHVHLTVREKLYSVNTVVAVAIELGSGMITLYASKIGLPVSNTHNTLGSAVGVGMLIHKLKIKWKIVRNISIFMFITMPCTGLISSGVMMLLYFIADNYHHFLS